MQAELENCWSCGHASERSIFCRFCSSLQPPSPDYYRFFGIPELLDLDVAELQNRFYAMSRMLHPDKFGRRTAEEQRYSLESTAILNDGFRTLRDPVQRAEYVLRNHGLEASQQGTKDVPPELLEEVFDLNIALEEVRSGGEQARPDLEQARERFLAMRGSLDSELKELFRRHDNSPDQAILGNIRSVLNRRTYIRNLLNEVEKALVA